METVYCLRCVKPTKIVQRDRRKFCANCHAQRNMHFYGNREGLLAKVAQDSKSKEIWKDLSSKMIVEASEIDFN